MIKTNAHTVAQFGCPCIEYNKITIKMAVSTINLVQNTTTCFSLLCFTAATTYPPYLIFALTVTVIFFHRQIFQKARLLAQSCLGWCWLWWPRLDASTALHAHQKSHANRRPHRDHARPQLHPGIEPLKPLACVLQIVLRQHVPALAHPGAGHGLAGGEPLRRVRDQELLDQFLGRIRHVSPSILLELVLAHDDASKELFLGSSHEWEVTSEEEENDDAAAPHVGLLIVGRTH
mmetsp:Transcript_20583/g.38864  ORF Transcript_20583/g.38864 Transcript_20583/m.38864 type:complete len:233 (-) Transcript_20583:1550-2248(-)